MKTNKLWENFCDFLKLLKNKFLTKRWMVDILQTCLVPTLWLCGSFRNSGTPYFYRAFPVNIFGKWTGQNFYFKGSTVKSGDLIYIAVWYRFASVCTQVGKAGNSCAWKGPVLPPSMEHQNHQALMASLRLCNATGLWIQCKLQNWRFLW